MIIGGESWWYWVYLSGILVFFMVIVIFREIVFFGVVLVSFSFLLFWDIVVLGVGFFYRFFFSVRFCFSVYARKIWVAFAWSIYFLMGVGYFLRDCFILYFYVLGCVLGIGIE